VKSSKRGTSNLSDSVNQRLDAYTVAAVAAQKTDSCSLYIGPCHHSSARWPYLAGALGMLALAPLAEAKIVYTSANVDIRGSSYYNRFDLNHDGINDIAFSQGCEAGTFVHRCWFDAKPLQKGNGIEGVTHTSTNYGWAAALKAGAIIGPAKGFVQAATVTMASTDRGHRRGYWWYPQTRYLGVAFEIKGKIHYGWMRFKGSSNRGATLTGYAYETIPGRAIKAGQTHGKDDIETSPDTMNLDDPGPGASLNPISDKPQPGSLGMLALGAPGVPLWRRKQEVEAMK